MTTTVTVTVTVVVVAIEIEYKWYVDNAASGANNGTSWADAWESFADIAWNSLEAGDTLYISGGDVSKTYNETLQPGAGGSGGRFLTIDVGANSPAPSGHSGTVIIDGNGVLTIGIWINAVDYIRLNGFDGSNNYRLQIQDIVSDNSPTKCCIYAYDCDRVYVDYVKAIPNTSRGIYFNQCTNSRIRGCDSRTGTIDLAVQTDPFYISAGVDNVFENNIAVQGNLDTAELHIDPLLVNNETRLIVRNNWFECGSGFVDIYENAFISNRITDYLYFYNNVVIGSDTDAEKTCQFLQVSPYTGLYYIWNNTFIASHTSGGVVQLFEWASDWMGAFRNNICYSPNGTLFSCTEVAISPASKMNNNCLYRAAGTAIGNLTDGNKTWAEWQALGYDANGINANPLFDAGDEYRLNNASSPCIDVGADLSAYFTTDRDGNLRPVGDWDIGAYEYVAP